ncbi:MAG: glycoside hydrolase family 3 N-terminal domain-containing protein [Cyanobacteria bacterium J06638_28]
MAYWLLKLAQFLLLLPLGWLGVHLRTPLLASVRGELQWLVPLGFVLLLSVDLQGLCRKTRQQAQLISRWGGLILCSLGLTVVLTNELAFQFAKYRVLNSDTAQLERLGAHMIVGYRSEASLKRLIEKQAIAGVFITLRNIQAKSSDRIRQTIAEFQAIREEQGLPPLWIATDQEGGVVSRLSPPLTQLPPLAEWISAAKTPDERQQAAQKYGDIQGRELADLGINLNFAPVVDLNKGIVNPDDKYSVIYQRAIAADSAVVAEVAQTYCEALAAHGVRCTLKHFPGLGRLETDTHLASATLDTPVAELAQDDWVPFQRIMGQSQAFTMLGHPILTAVDPQHPVSFSERVVNDILRQQWQYDGVLITDDFSMRAVFDSADGLKGAVVKALQTEVDLILISYDTDLYYPAMTTLMQAEQRDRLPQNRLLESKERLRQNQAALYREAN